MGAAYNALWQSGFRVLKDITLCTKKQVAKVNHIGKKAMDNIEAVLNEYGLTFVPDTLGIKDYPKAGDYVVLMVDEYDNFVAKLPKGTVLRVERKVEQDDIYPCLDYAMARIECKTDTDRTIYVSLGEIKLI